MRRAVLATLVASSMGVALAGQPAAAHARVRVVDQSRPPTVCATANATCASWRRLDGWSAVASVYATSFRPAGQPSVVAYATWMRSSATDLALYPGYEGPGATSLPRGPEMVPASARGRLLATFNSGFYEADRPAGFYTHGILYFPMVRGLATVVRYVSGRVGVVSWAGGPRPGANILMARQNLPLLVSDSRPSALSADNTAWGLTLHGVPAVWRTALGVDASGNLVYAAAPAQTSATLATIMTDLHCVRAMELDINPEWPIFVSYGAPGALKPSLVVPNPNQIPGRFLYPSTKDFFALYVRQQVGAPQPW